MKKNLYYRNVIQRGNINEKLLIGQLYFTSKPRLLLEVFIRKNFGERYFSMASAYSFAIILAAIPLLTQGGMVLFSRYGRGYFDTSGFLYHNALWYLFIGAFLYTSLKRQKEIKRNPSVFDFAKFSLCAGQIDNRFYSLWGRKWNIRQVETLIEPSIFFAIGLVFTLLGQSVGVLILVCSICYSWGYRVAYKLSDHFVMDKIDEMICNEGLQKAFVEDEDEDERGFRFYGRKPVDKDHRRKLVTTFIEDDDEDTGTAS